MLQAWDVFFYGMKSSQHENVYSFRSFVWSTSTLTRLILDDDMQAAKCFLGQGFSHKISAQKHLNNRKMFLILRPQSANQVRASQPTYAKKWFGLSITLLS